MNGFHIVRNSNNANNSNKSDKTAYPINKQHNHQHHHNITNNKPHIGVGENSVIRRAILDKNVRIPEGTIIGYHPEDDKKKYYVTESGIVVVEGHRSHVELATMSV